VPRPPLCPRDVTLVSRLRFALAPRCSPKSHSAPPRRSRAGWLSSPRATPAHVPRTVPPLHPRPSNVRARRPRLLASSLSPCTLCENYPQAPHAHVHMCMCMCMQLPGSSASSCPFPQNNLFIVHRRRFCRRPESTLDTLQGAPSRGSRLCAKCAPVQRAYRGGCALNPHHPPPPGSGKLKVNFACGPTDPFF